MAEEKSRDYIIVEGIHVLYYEIIGGKDGLRLCWLIIGSSAVIVQDLTSHSK